jgi:heterodisulfide reductase subunit A-like polyferredoxin
MEPARVDEKGGKVNLHWKEGDADKSLEVDLLVVSTPLAPAPALKEVAGMLGVKLDEFGYAVPEGRVQVAGPARRPMTLDEVFDDASAATGMLITVLART